MDGNGSNKSKLCIRSRAGSISDARPDCLASTVAAEIHGFSRHGIVLEGIDTELQQALKDTVHTGGGQNFADVLCFFTLSKRWRASTSMTVLKILALDWLMGATRMPLVRIE